MADEPKPVGMFITSDPDTTSVEQPWRTGAREVSRLPLRLLLVSDLAPQAGPDWAARAHLHDVDKGTFAEVMRTLAPRLTIEVPNRVGATPRQLDVDLQFSDLAAFEPLQVAQQLPMLAPLLQVRSLVEQVQAGTVDLPTFRARLAETGLDAEQLRKVQAALDAPPPPGTEASSAPSSPENMGDGGMLDRLLGMVDTGADGAASAAPEPPRPASNPGAGGGLFGALLDAVTGAPDERPRADKAAAGPVLGDLDRLLSEQLGAVFAHPGFRQLEAAWRGLKFLVDRLDFRRGVRLEVLAAPKEHLSEALYHQVLVPEHAGETGKPPLSALLLDYTFDHSAADVALLEDLAETGASLQVSVVTSVGPAFFGVSAYGGLAKLPPLWQHFERPEYIAFNKLRTRKEARHLALALPAFLLRPAYGDGQPGAFRFEEKEGLWGNAALAVGVRMSDSFVETGWPTHLTGAERRVEDLPLWKSAQGHTPLSVLIPESALSDFAKGGFVVLSGSTNRDYLFLARANTVCQPEAYENLMAATEARIHVTLACQLFVARAAHHVLVHQDEMVAGDDPAATLQEAKARLRALFQTEGQVVPPDAVAVEPVDELDVPGHMVLAVRLRTPPYVLDRAVSLVLGMQVRKAPSDGAEADAPPSGVQPEGV